MVSNDHVQYWHVSQPGIESKIFFGRFWGWPFQEEIRQECLRSDVDPHLGHARPFWGRLFQSGLEQAATSLCPIKIKILSQLESLQGRSSSFFSFMIANLVMLLLSHLWNVPRTREGLVCQELLYLLAEFVDLEGSTNTLSWPIISWKTCRINTCLKKNTTKGYKRDLFCFNLKSHSTNHSFAWRNLSDRITDQFWTSRPSNSSPPNLHLSIQHPN